MSDEEIDRSAREAEVEVLSERELLALISPDAFDAAETARSDAEGSTDGPEAGTSADSSEQSSPSDPAGATS